MKITKIAFADYGWNWMTGCKHYSEGCTYCYAEARHIRFYKSKFEIKINEDEWDSIQKFNNNKEGKIIFICPESDVFFEAPNISIELVNKHIFNVLDRIYAFDNNVYMMFTKRSKLMSELVPAYNKKINNLWCGVTIESEKYIHRLDDLKKIKNVGKKFISFEPLLSKIPHLDLTGIDWVIVGGESGTHLNNYETNYLRGLCKSDFTPTELGLEWVNSIKANCDEYRTLFYFKQWGGWKPSKSGYELNGVIYRDRPKFTLEEIKNDDKTKYEMLLKLTDTKVEKKSIDDKLDDLFLTK